MDTTGRKRDRSVDINRGLTLVRVAHWIETDYLNEPTGQGPVKRFTVHRTFDRGITFAPFCWSTHRIGRVVPLKVEKEPSHVPVTSTSGTSRLVQSPPAHPRLESASTIRSRPVHLMPVSLIGRVAHR
jgi:hypothetical protein